MIIHEGILNTTIISFIFVSLLFPTNRKPCRLFKGPDVSNEPMKFSPFTTLSPGISNLSLGWLWTTFYGGTQYNCNSQEDKMETTHWTLNTVTLAVYFKTHSPVLSNAQVAVFCLAIPT